MFVIDLIDTQHSSHFSFKNTISGVHALNTETQKVETIKASHVVLATGGMGKSIDTPPIPMLLQEMELHSVGELVARSLILNSYNFIQRAYITQENARF